MHWRAHLLRTFVHELTMQHALLFINLPCSMHRLMEHIVEQSRPLLAALPEYVLLVKLVATHVLGAGL